jgi:PIN domain
MTSRKGLVLDYPTVLAAFLQQNNVLTMMEKYEDEVDFRTPAMYLERATEELEQRLERRGGNPAKASTVLEQMSKLIVPLDQELYGQFEEPARDRLLDDEPDRWPVVAVALAFGHAIWALDEDDPFLGCGVPVWTTGTVEIYMRRP